MGEGSVKGKSAIAGEWVIRDKDGNIKEQGTDIHIEEGGQGEEG